MKYAGANWVAKTIKMPLSHLGIKVANVLGQVYQGIYHISDDVQRHETSFQETEELTFAVPYQFASFDRADLTLLYFCCQKAGVEVTISGHCHKYTKLVFVSSHLSDSIGLPKSHINNWGVILENYAPFLISQKSFSHRPNYHELFLWANMTPDQKVTACGVKRKEKVDFAKLGSILADAHASCTRITFQGRSRYSLELSFYQRNPRAVDISSKHSDAQTAKKLLTPLWDIDFNQVS